jgi:hypothetical protein
MVRRPHRSRRPNLDEKIKPRRVVDDPEEALRLLLSGQGATPDDWEPEDDSEET